MIFRVNEDRVVGTRRHARFATDADRLIEVDDAVGSFEHRCRWACGYAWSVHALVAARHLMRAPRLWKHADVDVLHVRACNRNRNDVFRLARGGARMTADAACVVDYLGPLNRGRRLRHRQAPVIGSQTISFPGVEVSESHQRNLVAVLESHQRNLVAVLESHQRSWWYFRLGLPSRL